jgi:hypothetical protein
MAVSYILQYHNKKIKKWWNIYCINMNYNICIVEFAYNITKGTD